MRRSSIRGRAAARAALAILTLMGCADAPARPPLSRPTPSDPPHSPAAAAGPVRLLPPPTLAAAVRRARAAPIRLTATDGTGLRLVALRGRAIVEAPLAFTELHLSFENPEDRVLEGTFQLSLPPGASVGRLAMKIDGRWQEGEVVERKRARAAYEDFLHRRQDPALLEQGAGNEVSARVFPIPARGVKEILIAYAQELVPGTPLVIPLRGLPEIGSVDLAVTGAQTKELRRSRFTPDDDFSVEASALGGEGGLRSGELAVIRVRAPVDARPDPLGSAVLLVDTSASRALDVEEQLRLVAAIAQEMIRAAGAAAPLTIACYDQEVEAIYEGPAGALGEAELQRIRRRQALGASDLGRALRWAGERARARGLRRVVLLSDGVATAGEAAPDALRAAAAALRGAGVERLDAIATGGIRDEALLERLVTAGLARDGAVIDGERPREVERRLSAATRSGVEVRVEGARWSWPRVLDGVQPGDEVLVYAEVPAAQPVSVVVGGRATQPTLRAAPRPLLERAWARAKIEALLQREAAEGSSPQIQREIIELSTTRRVLSPYTAFLTLETEQDYERFDIPRRGLADILTIEGDRLAVLNRSWPAMKAALAPQPQEPPRKEEPRLQRAAPLRDASPSASAPGDPLSADGNMWGDEIGESFGAGGLGLTGVGEGGGGRSEGIGLGAVGGVGHGAAEPPPPPTAEAPPAAGDGQGFGSGHGRLGGSHRTRPPAVRMGATQVSGRLPPEVIQRIVRQNFGRFRGCYEENLRASPSLAGRVAVRFQIDRAGAVTNVSDAGSDLPHAGVVACVLRAFRDLSFPAPEGGVVTVVYPIMFSPGDGPAAPSPASPSAASATARAAAPPEPERPAQADPYTGRFKQIMDALAGGKKDEALRAAWAWRAAEPGDVTALVALGEALEAGGDAASAARAYGSIIDLFPSRADLRRFAGGRLERLARGAGIDLAVDTYDKARAQRPDHPASHRLLAFARLRRGEHAAAFDALADGIEQRYPPGRFAGAERVLREDLGLAAAAWIRAEPARRAEILARLKKAGGAVEDAPSLRFVLTWETDANDVDFHIHDDRGGHAYYSAPSLPSGGELYADVTTGYGPECFTVRAPRDKRPARYTLQAHYYSRGPMGYGMGKLQIIDHDGKGGLSFEERPFVVMSDRAYVDLGAVTR